MLSTHQQRASDFLNAGAYLRAVADDGHGRGLLDLTDAFLHGVNFFGQSELNARRDERLRLTRARPEGGVTARRRTGELNDRGLQLLGYARDALARFREELAQYPGEADIADDADRALREIREQLGELELKPSDAQKVEAVIAEGFEAAKRGPGTIPDYLGSRLGELEHQRRQPERGTQENIPVWKVAAIAVAVGVWVWALFRCSWWGSCSLKEGLSYFVVFWISVLIARYD